MTKKKYFCAGCEMLFPLRLLDTVLLDEAGADASEEMYCEKCFPNHVVVAGDKWSEGIGED